MGSTLPCSNHQVTTEQINLIADALVLAMREAQGTYFYEEITLKRWILGDGGVSGNCEICNENADAGWIDMDNIFLGVDEDVDEPPAHPNCTCEIEIKDTRRRVYV